MAVNQDKFSRDLLLKNLRAMKHPTNLLKFGASGKPKFRAFQLSPNNQYIVWTSKNKTAEETQIAISSIKEIRYGQRTPKFKRNNRRDLEHLSFSVIYEVNKQKDVSVVKKGTIPQGYELDANSDSLDLVCKNEAEFQIWADTLVALFKGYVDNEILQLDALTAHEAKSVHKLKLEEQSSSSGLLHDHKVQESNDVYCFGWGEWGQTAMGNDVQAITAPKIVESLLGKGVTQTASGWSHTVFVLENGDMLQCGNRLGTGLSDDYFSPRPTPIPSRIGIMSIACGSFHSLAISERGELLSWGCNFNGQLGHGNTRDYQEPTIIATTRANVFDKVAAGGMCSMALGSNGSVFTFGSGQHGALGHNDNSDQLIPKPVEDLTGANIVKIAAGSGFMFACTEREVYSWGWNGCGQLGLGHEEDQLRPHVVDSLRGQRVLDIACGAAHTLAVVYMAKMGSQVLYAWGSNSFGQLGQASKNIVNKPRPSTFMQQNVEIVEIACGDMHSCLRTANGNVYSCGSNLYGQLGLGHKTAVSEFTIMSTFKDKEARSVICGGEHTCVLTAREWVADEEVTECMKCKTPFSTFTRKHHCRNCFGIFCNACSSKKVAILKNNKTEPERVCEACYDKITRGK